VLFVCVRTPFARDAIDRAHSAVTNGREDLVMAEFIAWLELCIRMDALRLLENRKLTICSHRSNRRRSSELCGTLLESRANRTSKPKESQSDCSSGDAEYAGNLIHGRPVQLMLKQNALTGAAIAQDSTNVNRRKVHSKVAPTLHKQLCGPFSSHFVAEQIQGDGIYPRAHPAFPSKLMQTLPPASPGCL